MNLANGFKSRIPEPTNGFKVTGKAYESYQDILEQVVGALSGVFAENGSSASPPSVYYRFCALYKEPLSAPPPPTPASGLEGGPEF